MASCFTVASAQDGCTIAVPIALLEASIKRLGKARRARGLKNGYRSGLEYRLASEMEARGIPFAYEEDVIEFIKPVTKHRYTPDFKVTTRNGHVIYIEAKGFFEPKDRKKHLNIRDSHPELDIRFVFGNANSRLSKKSKTTYGKWCTQHGFLWADKHVPEAWLEE